MRSHHSQLLRVSYRALLLESKQLPVLRKYGTVSAVPTTEPSATATPPSVFQNALNANGPRNNWTREEIKEIYDTPLMQLAFAAVILPTSLCIWVVLIKYLGHCPPKISQSLCNPNVHTYEHQDRRMQRRLLILCPKFPLQDWSPSHQDGDRRLGARRCSNRQGQWKYQILHGSRVEGYAGPENESQEYQGDGQWGEGYGNGSLRHTGNDRS